MKEGAGGDIKIKGGVLIQVVGVQGHHGRNLLLQHMPPHLPPLLQHHLHRLHRLLRQQTVGEMKDSQDHMGVEALAVDVVAVEEVGVRQIMKMTHPLKKKRKSNRINSNSKVEMKILTAAAEHLLLIAVEQVVASLHPNNMNHGYHLIVAPRHQLNVPRRIRNDYESLK